MNKIKKSLPFLIPVLIAVIIIILFRTVFIIGFVPSESMEPTIHKGSYVLGIRDTKKIDVGDIVIFEKDGELLVKRVAYVAGDEVNGMIVPNDCYYLLGDNSNNSYDSRYWDNPLINRNQIFAKVL